MYDSLFEETCVLKLENTELIKVSELQEEIESLRLVRTNLNEKITLKAKLHRLNEMALICIGEDEKDDHIASLKAQVQELMIS